VASQTLRWDATTFRMYFSTVLMYRYTIPSDCGCRGVVRILLTPRRCNTYIRRDFVVRPWSLCSSRGTPKWQKKLVTSSQHCRSLLIRNGVGFRPLDNIVHSDQEVSASLVASWEGLCYVTGYPFERDPDVVLIGPDSWFGGRDWLHRCRAAGTTSQHRFLRGGSSTFAGPYSGSCRRPSDFLTAHHVVRSLRRSLFFK
jgi:hypothetical protein